MSAAQCMAGDWSGQGYSDGQQGLTMSRLDDHAKACAEHGVTPDASAYADGRRQGLVHYCTPGKGFEVGRSGSGYAGVCPSDLEADFMYGYRDGQVVHEVEQALANARSRVDSLGARLEELDEKNLILGPARNAVKARMPWLMITVAGQLLAAFIIGAYKGTVSQAAIAISFMPLLTGLSGNMGTQTNTITVRGLSQNLITADNLLEKVFRELKVALMTGVTFAVVIGFISYIIYHNAPLSTLLFSWIIISVCISAVLGIVIPYSCDRILKIDPASVGGPMITTVSDILTFSIYLYILTMFLDQMTI